jgi:hypothetical protein
MSPLRLLHKLLQEKSGSDRPAALATDVLQVGDRALDHILVAGLQRQRPDTFVSALGSGLDVTAELVVRAVEAGKLLAQTDDAGTFGSRVGKDYQHQG